MKDAGLPLLFNCKAYYTRRTAMKSVAVNRNNTETFGKRLRRDWNLNKWKYIMIIPVLILLGLDSDTFYIYHVAAVMVDNLRRLLLGINLSDKAIMDFDFPGVGFPV